MLFKRRCPPALQFDPGTKKLIISKKRLPGLEEASEAMSAVNAPDWLRPIIKKLPSADRGQARASVVDNIVAVLSRVTIPKPSALIHREN